MANIPDSPTIPEITIIIQIKWSLWFQKSMILDVCPDIINISLIPDITTIPEIPTIIKK
jgi:hypothetical protein